MEIPVRSRIHASMGYASDLIKTVLTITHALWTPVPPQGFAFTHLRLGSPVMTGWSVPLGMFVPWQEPVKEMDQSVNAALTSLLWSRR
jgi:hypothetical protein